MRIELAYGRDGLTLDLDESRYEPQVLLPRNPPRLADAHGAFLRAVRAPAGTPPPWSGSGSAVAAARCG